MQTGDRASTSSSSELESANANYLERMISNKNIMHQDKIEIINQFVASKGKRSAENLISLLKWDKIGEIGGEYVIKHVLMKISEVGDEGIAFNYLMQLGELYATHYHKIFGPIIEVIGKIGDEKSAKSLAYNCRYWPRDDSRVKAIRMIWARGKISRIEGEEVAMDLIRSLCHTKENIQQDEIWRQEACRLIGDLSNGAKVRQALEDMLSDLNAGKDWLFYEEEEFIKKAISKLDKKSALTTPSGEASSSRHAGESRSPERVRSGEGSSAQGEQLFDQMRKVIDEYPQLKEREKKLEQEVQQLQQEHNRTQEQLTKAQQERDQVREQLRKIQQEQNPTQEQLRQVQQNLNRAQEQLRKAQQERNQAQQNLNLTWEQLISTQQERDQAQQDLAQMQEQLRQTQHVDERGQSSRGELGGDDALPTTVEGMQEQLEGGRRRQQELFERVLKLQEGIQRTLRERGEDMPSNERLNELLRQGIWNLVGNHRLDETLFPRQEYGQLPSIRQRVRNFYLQTVSEYASLGLTQGQIAGEFIDQLEDQMVAHNRPSQEWIDTSEDIQEQVTGIRRDRTRR